VPITRSQADAMIRTRAIVTFDADDDRYRVDLILISRDGPIIEYIEKETGRIGTAHWDNLTISC